MIKQCIKFEISKFIHYKNMKSDKKRRNRGGFAVSGRSKSLAT